MELFRLASGQDIVSRQKEGEVWTARGLVRVIDRILESPDLTAIVKTVLRSKPAKIKAVKKVLEIE
jgi:hypothetical protein